MAKRRTPEEIIAAVQDEIAQKQARLDDLVAKQQQKNNKARTNRLCKRHGQIEKLFPRLAEMTDEQFNVFVDKTLLTGFAEKIIKQILPPLPPAEPQDGADTAQGGESTPQKPAESAAQSNTPPCRKARRNTA